MKRRESQSQERELAGTLFVLHEPLKCLLICDDRESLRLHARVEWKPRPDDGDSLPLGGVVDALGHHE